MLHSQELDKDVKLSKGIVRRVVQFARPYRLKLLALLVVIAVGSVFSVLFPVLLTKSIIDDAIGKHNLHLLNILVLGWVVVLVGQAVTQIATRWLASSIGEGLIYDLRVALYDHVQGLPIAFFTRTQTGALMSRLSSDVIGAQRAVTETSAGMVQIVLDVTLALILMFKLNWHLTLLSIAMIPIFILPTRRMGKVLQRLIRKQMENNAAMSGQMGERFQIGGALLVKLFGRRDREVAQFSQKAANVRDLGVKTAIYGRLFFVSFMMVSSAAAVLVYWLGGREVINETIKIGVIIAFIQALQRLFMPVTQLSNLRVEVMTALVSFDRVFEVLDFPSAVSEKPGAFDIVQPQGKVTFEKVWFTYPPGSTVTLKSLEARPERPSSESEGDGAEAGPRRRFLMRSGNGGAAQVRGDGRNAKQPENIDGGNGGSAALVPEETGPVLKDVSFEILPGKMVALVGPSGAGKTTISMLIPRLYDVSEGAVLIDGHDARDLTLDSLRGAIGVVTQDPHMFHDNIRNNLLYAKPDANEAQMIEAAKAAQIHELIASTPDGYDTIVGERGYRLSGGEKQRLAIARLLLKNPVIMILDEATSHLDSESESLIQRALAEAFSGRSSLVIAHRLSTVVRADEILVVEAGRIVQRGRHGDLLATGGLYADLYRTQFERAPA